MIVFLCWIDYGKMHKLGGGKTVTCICKMLLLIGFGYDMITSYKEIIGIQRTGEGDMIGL